MGTGMRKFWKLLFLILWIGCLGIVSFVTITDVINDFLDRQIQRKTYIDWKNDKNESLIEDPTFKTRYENATALKSYSLYREEQFKANQKLVR